MNAVHSDQKAGSKGKGGAGEECENVGIREQAMVVVCRWQAHITLGPCVRCRKAGAVGRRQVECMQAV